MMGTTKSCGTRKKRRREKVPDTQFPCSAKEIPKDFFGLLLFLFSTIVVQKFSIVIFTSFYASFGLNKRLKDKNLSQ